MNETSHRRPSMTLFSSEKEIFSHQIRFVLAEKDVSTNIIHVTPNQPCEDLLDLNPYNTVPTLVHKHLVLYHPRIIVEYINEHLPHPSLMPDTPFMRAKSRLVMAEINENWYGLLKKINPTGKACAASKRLINYVLSIAPILSCSTYLLGDTFGLVDCCLAPLLWHLPNLGIHLPPEASSISRYSARIFARSAFIKSLSDAERITHRAHWGATA